MDRFPEAFRRFEKVVDVDKMVSFRQLHFSYASWAGRKWQDTPLQLSALAAEARKRGIPVALERRTSVASGGAAHVSERVAVSWRHETVTVRGSFQDRYRDLGTGRFMMKP